MRGRTVRWLRLAALLAASPFAIGCSPASDPESNDGSSILPPSGDGATTSDAPDASSLVDGGASPDAPSTSPANDGGSRDASAPPSDAARSDAALDVTPEATPDAIADIHSDAPPDALMTSTEGGPAATRDGGDAQPDGPNASLPGCGDWLSASPTHTGNRSTLQLNAAGRDGGFGSVLDWNVTGGWGTGEFTHVTPTSATFTCLTPGPVVVTATDPAGPPCPHTGYDQASVAIQCDAFIGRWASVSVGASSACGLTVDGTAWCWGDASLDGALGDGTTTPSTYPVQVSGLANSTASVSVGRDFACALTTGGAVQCWGAPLGVGGLGGLAPVPVMGLSSGVTAVSSSAGRFACALTATQSVVCWGDGSVGELGDGSTTSSGVPVAVVGLTGSTAALSAGGAFACALSTTGAVQCWGDDSSRELGTGAPAASFSASPVTVAGLPASVTAVAAGGAFACALTSGGAVYCWGANDRAQLGSFSGSSNATPLPMAGLPTDVRSIAAGQNFACALTSGGAVWCWGDDISGQLGNDAIASFPVSASSAVPVPVSGLASGVASISLGGLSACAVTSAGDLLCWGRDDAGQLGNPATTFCPATLPANPCLSVPVPIEAAGRPAPAGGATSGWCSQQQGPHTLCEDFDQSFPGQFTIQTSAGSTVGEDDLDDQSVPRSMVATTSPVSPLNVASTAWATYVSPTAGASFHLQADFKVGSDCFANVFRPVTIARVDYLDVGFTMAYSVSPALSGAGWVMQAGDSEATPQTPGPFGVGGGGSTFLPADQWARLTLSAQLGAGASTGGFSLALLTPNAPTDGGGGGIFGPSQAPASAPVLRIGADAAAHGCTVHVDNVLFDVR